jgi:hypothetical protein
VDNTGRRMPELGVRRYRASASGVAGMRAARLAMLHSYVCECYAPSMGIRHEKRIPPAAARLSLASLVMLMMACIFLLPSMSAANQAGSPAAVGLALKYLRSIEKSASFSFSDGRGKELVVFGASRPPLRVWRVLVIRGDEDPRLVWDSTNLLDWYFDVGGVESISADDDGSDGYTVTIRGCARHECGDGKFGFAIYASRTERMYIAHVVTKDDGSYRVSYYPGAGIPTVYREELNRMMCSDNGISRPSTLPIKCPP